MLSTGGDPHLGGDDWDAAIAQWLIDTYLVPKGVDCKVRPPLDWHSMRAGW